jgi:molybdate transport system substrate-binding protein
MPKGGHKGKLGIGLIILIVMALVWVRSSRYMGRSGRRATRTLNVFAAASLAGPFGEMRGVFESRHPGMRVMLNFAGSQELALQIDQGADCDVFASADQRWMSDVQQHGLLLQEPRTFAHNEMVVVLSAHNAGQLRTLHDLTRTGVKIVVAVEAVPAGRYTRDVLNRLGQLPGFDSTFQREVLEHVVSEEENVKAVLGKVQLGEADAGFVYRSDVTTLVDGEVKVLEIPSSANSTAHYPIAVLRNSSAVELAREFVSFALSSPGQEILAKHHFIPVESGKEQR